MYGLEESQLPRRQATCRASWSFPCHAAHSSVTSARQDKQTSVSTRENRVNFVLGFMHIVLSPFSQGWRKNDTEADSSVDRTLRDLDACSSYGDILIVFHSGIVFRMTRRTSIYITLTAVCDTVMARVDCAESVSLWRSASLLYSWRRPLPRHLLFNTPQSPSRLYPGQTFAQTDIYHLHVSMNENILISLCSRFS